jgi:hypothetical protein
MTITFITGCQYTSFGQKNASRGADWGFVVQKNVPRGTKKLSGISFQLSANPASRAANHEKMFHVEHFFAQKLSKPAPKRGWGF